MVIVDESHYIKNRKAAQTKFVVPLVQKAERKFLLTGTPALARPEEVKFLNKLQHIYLLFKTIVPFSRNIRNTMQ